MLSACNKDTTKYPSLASLEYFLYFFTQNKLDLNSTFLQDGSDAKDLRNFLMANSSPNQQETWAFLKAALIILLFHPLIQKKAKQSTTIITTKLPPLRSILLQVIGRCVRRATRSQIKTLPITVPLLLPHLSDSSRFEMIIKDLHCDLKDRFKKVTKDQFYSDPLTANLLIVFDYLYLINESFSNISYSGQVPPALFYYKFQNFDICEDYAHWRDLSEIKDRNLPFAFCDYPWILDLEQKRILLQASNGLRQRHHLQDSFFRALFDGVQTTSFHIKVHRDNLLLDAKHQILGKPAHDLAKQFRVSFINEEGVDEGGLRKEFFQICWNNLFENRNNCKSVETALFVEVENGLFWFNPRLVENDLSFENFTLVGTLLALAIYNGILVAPRFPLLLFKKLMNWPLQLDDYTEIDFIMVQSINRLSEKDLDGMYHVVPGLEDYNLIPNGSNIPVTSLNNYVSLLSEYFLNSSISWQFSAFKLGFESVSQNSVIYGYRPDELFSLAYGSPDFDITDLKLIANYEGGYSDSSLQVKWFWQLITCNFSLNEQADFLAFVTGSSRSPLGGLIKLNSFTITCIPGDSDRLPTAHTCFNTLLLPQYSTQSKLESKLRLAIQHHHGFGLI